MMSCVWCFMLLGAPLFTARCQVVLMFISTGFLVIYTGKDKDEE